MAEKQRAYIIAHHDKDMDDIKAVIQVMQRQIRNLEDCKARVEEQMKQADKQLRQILDILERVHPRAGAYK